jgi:hypothetical protein
MNDRRRTTIGLTLAGALGVIALTVLWLWPRAKNPTLFALAIAWLYIQMIVMAPRIPGAGFLSMRALHQRIRDEVTERHRPQRSWAS